jgi:flagellar biosynthesis protein FlhF
VSIAKTPSEPLKTATDEVAQKASFSTAKAKPAQPRKVASFTQTISEAVESTALNEMKAELAQLRNALDTQIAETRAGQWGQHTKARSDLFEKLTHIGLGVDLITQLINATDSDDDLETASRKVLLALKNALKISATDAIEQGGVVVLHGPTGAGKTTTLAKLAAQFLQKNESRDLVLVCADNERIGAYEQLQTFAKLLGVSVIRVRDESELNKRLKSLGSKKLVLVDSAGMVQEDLRNPERLFAMTSQQEHVHHLLVLSATMQRASLERVFDSMAETKIEGVIITKMDDSVHLGNVLTSLARHQVPLVSWTHGQSIAKDIQRANAALLVSKAMHLNKSAIESKDDRILFSMLQSVQSQIEFRREA